MNTIEIIATLASAIGTIVLAGLTYSMVKEMKETREETIRPYVVLYLLQKEFKIYFICQNIGKGVARNINVFFNENFKDSQGHSVKDILFSNTIPEMPPNYKICTFLSGTIEAYRRADKDKQYVVNVSYQGDTGKPYQGKYHLKINMTPEKMFTLSNETLIVDEIKKISSSLNSIARDLADVNHKGNRNI